MKSIHLFVTPVVGLAALLLASCAQMTTSHTIMDAAGSREKFLGRVAGIRSPAATERHLFMRVHYESGSDAIVRYDLASRNADFAGSIPTEARPVRLVEIRDAGDPAPRDVSRPFVLVWKGGGTFYSSRLRWLDGKSDLAMNIPVYGSYAVHNATRTVFGAGEMAFSGAGDVVFGGLFGPIFFWCKDNRQRELRERAVQESYQKEADKVIEEARQARAQGRAAP